ncbi:hypothetical protein M9H77_28258 [Catharanthus roseus]|uniref:Uncharacterized protein n=1 Tax=Catharanthus roseus TaxID=4058 RepID=A0ACC0AGR5_CATRO|nr:hypothetical protein M9H77_28258 [Catharanthus roseus]
METTIKLSNRDSELLVFEEESVFFCRGFVNKTRLITRLPLLNSGIRARRKFDLSGVWCLKVKAILVQNKIAPAICTLYKYPESWTGEILAKKLSDAHSCVTLHLKDNVLREINKIDNAYEIWTKLEKLYLGKFLSNKIYLKE